MKKFSVREIATDAQKRELEQPMGPSALEGWVRYHYYERLVEEFEQLVLERYGWPRTKPEDDK